MSNIGMEFVNQVESHAVSLERLQAVLEEVSGYFDSVIEPGTFEADYLIRRSGHITLLIHVTEQMLTDSIKEVNGISKSAVQSIKAQKGGAA